MLNTGSAASGLETFAALSTAKPVLSPTKKDSALNLEIDESIKNGHFRGDGDGESDDEVDMGDLDKLITKLNTSLPHRGPAAKAKPRKKNVDADNELESLNRKLINVSLDIDGDGSRSSDPASLSQANDPTAVRYLLPTHAKVVLNALDSDVPDFNLTVIKQLRRFMCLDEVPDKTEKVIALGILPALRKFLIEASHAIQYETCWVVTNIAAGLSEHTKSIVDAGMVEPLIKLLESTNEQVRVQAAWALGNIAGDCKQFTQILLDAGIMIPLLAIPTMTTYNYKKDCQALHVVCWVIANLCRWDNKDWNQIRPSFHLLTDTIMNCRDDDVLSEAIWAISRIFHGKHPSIKNLVTPRLCTRLVHLLQSTKILIQNPVLRVMTNVSGDSDPAHTQILLESGILFAISNILYFRHNQSNQVIMEVLHCLSNITAGTTAQKEAVSVVGLFAPVREILQEGDYKTKKEACHVLRNAVDRDATPEHFRDVVGPQGEIFNPLTKFLVESQSDAKTHLQAIETLNIIFSRGNEPLIQALYPYVNYQAPASLIEDPAQAVTVPKHNVYVSCMNNLSASNFENIWSAFAKANGDAEDLTPLLLQVTMGNSAGGMATDMEEDPEKSKAAAAALVTEQRLRKRIAADLKMMVETYFPEKFSLRRGIVI